MSMRESKKLVWWRMFDGEFEVGGFILNLFSAISRGGDAKREDTWLYCSIAVGS